MRNPAYASFKHSGVVMDLPPEEVPAENWTGCANMQFQDRTTRSVGGYESYAGAIPGSGPLFALNVLAGPIEYWIYCTASNVYVTDGVSHWDITPAGGLNPSVAGDWTGCVLNGVPVLSNGRNAPMYWNLNTAVHCANLPGWPTGATCKAIRAFKYHLFALNVNDGATDYPQSLWWSKSALPGAIPSEWKPTPSNDAGDMVLGDTPGAIVDGLALRDAFIVYKDFATHSLSYVAGQYVYSQRKLFLTSGIAGRNCIAEINGFHWAFTGTDLIRHDGQNFESMVQDKVKRAMVESVDPAQAAKVCIAARHRNNQVWVNVPEQGGSDLTKAFVINTINGDCGLRTLPGVSYVARGVVNFGASDISWDVDAQPWDDDITFWSQASYDASEDGLLMTDRDANALWAVDVSDLNDGAPISAMVTRESLPIGDNILRALVTRVIPRLEGRAGDVVFIKVGGQGYFDQPIRWSPRVPFVLGSDVGANVLIEGRLISVSFEAETGRQWKVHSYKLEYVDQGLF